MDKVETAFCVDGDRNFYTMLDPTVIPSMGDHLRLTGESDHAYKGWYYVHVVDRIYDLGEGVLSFVTVGLRTLGSKS